MNGQHRSGLVTASVLAMILVGLISGTLIGVVLGGASARPLLLAILCAIVAAILSLAIRNLVLDRNATTTAPLSIRNLALDRNAATTVPLSMKFMWVVIASLIGGLAGHELAIDVTEPPPLPLVGALSGLVASVLIASYAITIFMLRNRLSASSE